MSASQVGPLSPGVPVVSSDDNPRVAAGASQSPLAQPSSPSTPTTKDSQSSREKLSRLSSSPKKPHQQQQQHTQQAHHRPPAPSLFVGPPARNASAPDLHLTTTLTPSHAPLGPADANSHLPTTSPSSSQPHSSLPPNPLFADPSSARLPHQSSSSSRNPHGATARAASSTNIPGVATAAAGAPPSTLRPADRDRDRHRHRADADADAIWTEMRRTLDGVELRAEGAGAAVFSREHARALEELRRGQIALARAWTRSEGDEGGEDGGEGEEGEVGEGGGAGAVGAGEVGSEADGTPGRGAGSGAAQGRRGSVDGAGRTRLEVETENDILLARRRRQANDRYFERVNRGVVDVVAKLQDVAQRMRAVEAESKEVWGERAGG